MMTNVKYIQIALLLVLQFSPARSSAGSDVDFVTRLGTGVSVRYDVIGEDKRVTFPLVVQAGLILDKIFCFLLSGSFTLPVTAVIYSSGSIYGSLSVEFHFLPSNKFIDPYFSTGIGYGGTMYSPNYDSHYGFESGIFNVGAGIEIPVNDWLDIGFKTDFILRFPAKEYSREKHYFESQDFLLMFKMCF